MIIYNNSLKKSSLHPELLHTRLGAVLDSKLDSSGIYMVIGKTSPKPKSPRMASHVAGGQTQQTEFHIIQKLAQGMLASTNLKLFFNAYIVPRYLMLNSENTSFLDETVRKSSTELRYFLSKYMPKQNVGFLRVWRNRILGFEEVLRCARLLRRL